MAVSAQERRFLLNQTNQLATADVGALWKAAATLADADFAKYVVDGFPDVVDPWIAAASDLAATWFEETVPGNADVADPIPVERLTKSAQWALGAKGGLKDIAVDEHGNITATIPTDTAKKYSRTNPYIDGDPEYMKKLENTLRTKGYNSDVFKNLPTIEVGESGKYAVISDGNHRVWAADAIGIKDIRVTIITGEDDAWAKEYGFPVEKRLSAVLERASSPIQVADASALAKLQHTTQRAVFDGARQTTLLNVDRTGIRWARDARADACSFCRLLATRTGKYLYRSRDTAKTKVHDDCHCLPIEVVNPGDYQLPEHVQAWEDEYLKARANAGTSNAKAILSAWRAQAPEYK